MKEKEEGGWLLSLVTIPLFEAIVGAIASALVYFLKPNSELWEIIWIVGLMLAFARYAISKEIGKIEKLYVVNYKILKHREVIDLAKTYNEISELEFSSLKIDIISNANRELSLMARMKRSGEMSTGSYYNWLINYIDGTKGRTKIWAISTMLGIEWDDSPQEREFLRANLEAAARGVKIERVFIVKSADVNRLCENHAISAQLNEGSGNFDLKYVVEEYLKSGDPRLLKKIGAGIIAFDDKVVLVDKEGDDGIRGTITLNQDDVLEWKGCFSSLKQLSTALRPCIASQMKAIGNGSADNLVTKEGV